MPRALLSVSDKTGIVDVGRGLAARGFELVSTGGTARALTDAGLAVTNVSDVTGFPEMMDGRVKTLHPALHGGILARRDHPDDLRRSPATGSASSMSSSSICIRSSRRRRSRASAFDELVEEIDIGGPQLVRAAAKNFRDVLVVVDPGDYPKLLDGARPDADARVPLRADAQGARAHRRVRHGDRATLATIDLHGDTFERRAAARRRCARRPPRSGARQDSRSAIRRESRISAPPGIGTRMPARRRIGCRRSRRRDHPAGQGAVVHEPARSRRGRAHRARIRRAGGRRDQAHQSVRRGDRHVGRRRVRAGPRRRRLAAFGGIVALNRPLDRAAAEAIVSTFIEAVIAPAVEPDARADPGRASRTCASSSPISSGLQKRRASRCGRSSARALVQERDSVRRSAAAVDAARLPEGLRVVTKRQPSAEEWEALRFAWRICAHVKSNTVIFTDASADARDRRRSDEPRRRRQRGGDEGAQPRGGSARRSQSPRPTRSFRSATASTRWRPPARPRSCSPADRCATRR